MRFWKSEMIRREEEGWSATTGQHVCSGCVNDVALKSALDQAGDHDEQCDFCESSPAADMSVLLEIFVSGLKTEFADADNEGVSYDGREGGYQRDRTWDTADLVSDFADVLTGDGLVDAVIAAMTDKTWVEVGFAGPRHDEALSAGWERFCEAVKYETRYVFWLRADQGEEDEPGAGDIPAARILQEIGAIVDDDRVGILYELPVGLVLWRAQPHDDEGAGLTFTGPRLGTAPRDKALRANRMSPAGIPMFYGATDKETAFAETAAHDSRPWATAGEFRTSQPCLVVDFTRLPAVPSMFDPGWRGIRRPLLFLHEFVKDLSKPLVTTDRDQIDYVPTQIVTEYFLRIHGGGKLISGILYPSAITNKVCAVLDVPNDRCLDSAGPATGALALTLINKETRPLH